jgi:hypothetical protein
MHLLLLERHALYHNETVQLSYLSRAWLFAKDGQTHEFRDVLLLERVVGETDRMNPCCDMGCFDCCSLRVLSASDKGHRATADLLLLLLEQG